MKKYLSPHAINLYLKCPRAFYYYSNGYQELIPPQYLREAIELGNLVHRIIQKYYQFILQSNVSALSEEIITEYLRKAYRETISLSDSEKLGRILQNFRSFEKWRVSSNLFFVKPECVECEFIRDDLGLHGVLDVVFKKKRDNKLVVVDWKTGEYASVFEPNIRLQLSIYAYLVGTDEAYVVNLYESEEPEKVDLMSLNEIVSVINTIRSDKLFVRIPGNYCRICSFQIPCFGPSMLRTGFLGD